MKKLIVLLVLISSCASNKYVAEKRIIERSPDSISLIEPAAKVMDRFLFPTNSYQGPFEINPPNFDREAAKIYLPLQYESKEKWPLIILIHGFGGTAGMQDAYLTMSGRASDKGFLLLTPEGTKNSGGKQFWNATDACCDFENTQVNDVDYLTKLIAEVKAKYHVDESRIYLFGHSNGGFMANRLACEIGEQIAGIASLAGGSFKNMSQCRAPHTIAYLQIHAENDSVVKFDDDPRYAGGVETTNQWVTKNNCPNAPLRSIHEDDFVALIPGVDTVRKVWEKCRSGTEVSLWKIKKFEDSKHNPHVPLFNMNFSDAVIDHLFKFKKFGK